MYDFPQKAYRTRAVNALMLLLSRSPAFRKRIEQEMIAGMSRPLQKVIEDGAE